jgi:hypothetical protein
MLPATQDLFYRAINIDDIELVKIFLSLPEIDPSRHNNQAIKTALWYNYTEIIDLLLDHPRVKETFTEKQHKLFLKILKRSSWFFSFQCFIKAF